MSVLGPDGSCRVRGTATGGGPRVVDVSPAGKTEDQVADAPVLAEMSETYTQDADACDGGGGQALTVSVQDGGGGPYLVISTERWAMDEADLVRLVKICRAALRRVKKAQSGRGG